MRRHAGIALAVVLVLLATGSLIAVTGMAQAVVDERIAGNQRQVAQVFMAAEAGLLRVGRWWGEASDGVRHDQLFWGDPEAAAGALQALDRTIRPGLTWAIMDLRFGEDHVLISVRGQMDGVGATRVVSVRYRPPLPDDPPGAPGQLFGWAESPQIH